MSAPDYAGSKRLRDARDAVDAAVREWVAAAAEADPEREHDGVPLGDPYVMGWVVGVDWTSTGLEATDATAFNVVVSEGQRRSTSIGLGSMVCGAFQ